MSETSINAHNKIDVTGLIINGKPEIRGFDSKAAPKHLQDEFDILNEFQFTKAYSWVLGIIKDRLMVRKLIEG